jgi:hypothetical protein
MKTRSIRTFVLAAAGFGLVFGVANHLPAKAANSAKLARKTSFAIVTDSARTTDAAFRDGLYLGKRHAENGESSQIPVGRWSRTEDRQRFAEGFQLSLQNARKVSSSNSQFADFKN